MAPPDEEGPNPGDFEQYRLEIWPAQAPARKPVWSQDDVVIEAERTVTIELARGFLDSGRYEIRLYGLVLGSEQVPLATFDIEEP